MKYAIKVLRRKSRADEPYWQRFELETELESATVATALSLVNKEITDKVMWDCSCLQKKCGACAMVINGRPQLACNARLKECANKKAGRNHG